MSDRKFEAQKLSEVLSHISKQKYISEGLKKLRIKELWDEIMGENISVYTEKIRLEKFVLYIKIKRPSLKEELRFGEHKILKL